MFGGRLLALEKNMVHLETLFGQFVTRMDSDHKAMQKVREEDRESFRELGQKMEKSVSDLAGEMKKIADRTASNDNKAAGALDAGRWIVGTLLGVGTLITGALGLYVAYQAGQRGTHYNPEPPVPQYSQRAR